MSQIQIKMKKNKIVIIILIILLISCKKEIKSEQCFHVFNTQVIIGEDLDDFKKYSADLNHFDNEIFNSNYSFFCKQNTHKSNIRSKFFYGFYKNKLVYFSATIDSLKLIDLNILFNDFKIKPGVMNSTVIKNGIEQYVDVTKTRENTYKIQMYLVCINNKSELIKG